MSSALLASPRGSRRSPRSFLRPLGLLAALGLFSASFAGCSADKTLRTTDENPSDGDDDDDDGADASVDAGKRDARMNTEEDDDTEKTDDDDDVIDPNSCAAIRQEAPPGKGGVDIIFLVDTSGSMIHALAQVTQNLATFVQEFENTEVDTRVVMITQNDPAQGSPLAGERDKYRFIKSVVDSKQLFQTATARFGDYSDFLRPNAVTQFVMVTDDEDSIEPAAFKQQMEQLLGHGFTQHAIASESVMGAPCISESALMINPLCQFVIPGIGGIPAICAAAAIGARYYTLADDTGGEQLSICKADWTEVFSRLKEAVIEAVPLPCDYALADASETDFDPEHVSIVYKSDGKESEFPKALMSGQCGDKIGWFYDSNDSPKTISLCPAACTAVQQGGKINIEFGCKVPTFL